MTTMENSSKKVPRILQVVEFWDELEAGTVRSVQRRGELGDAREGGRCSVAHLVNWKEREEVAIAYEGLRKTMRKRGPDDVRSPYSM